VMLLLLCPKSDRLLLTFANKTQCGYRAYPYNDISLVEVAVLCPLLQVKCKGAE